MKACKTESEEVAHLYQQHKQTEKSPQKRSLPIFPALFNYTPVIIMFHQLGTQVAIKHSGEETPPATFLAIRDNYIIGNDDDDDYDDHDDVCLFLLPLWRTNNKF